MRRFVVALSVAAGLLAGAVALAGCGGGGGTDTAKAQTVRFQKPNEIGRSPFTRPADVRGKHTIKVKVGSGPFGGTGNNRVCDRELLISSLKARPDRLRAWARVRGIRPTVRSVSRFIRRMKPVTLTRDTRVTNYTFENGRAVAFQAILQAGTAVLVDRKGRPVARCRCGNPLTPPVFVPTATCIGCPPNYKPPPPCNPPSVCWRLYPDPPPVIVIIAKKEPTGTTTTETTTTETTPSSGPASAFFTPRVGSPQDTYVLHVSGFNPNKVLNVRLTRPDGVSESYGLTTGSDGSGSFTFPHVNNPQPGTYTAVVEGDGKQATASTTVSGSQQQPQQTTPTQTQTTQQLNCDAPRSQLEFEQCRDAGQLPSQNP